SLSKARPRQTNRATDSASETPLRTRRDFFRPQTNPQTPFRESNRGHDWTEWRCQQRPLPGSSFAGRRLQSSANKERRRPEYQRKISKVSSTDFGAQEAE